MLFRHLAKGLGHVWEWESDMNLYVGTYLHENNKWILLYNFFIDIFGIGMAARTLYNVIYTIEGSINYKGLFFSILQKGRFEISSPYELLSWMFMI